MTNLEVGVLGELTVTRDGDPIPMTGPGRRALLGLLAAGAGRVVPLERIVDGLWGTDPPVSATKVVQTHVSQLRRLLEPDRRERWRVLVTHPSGYELVGDEVALDVARFEEAVQEASQLPAADAVQTLRRALALWRGPPYAGIDRPFVAAEAARLEQLRVAASIRCLAGELAEVGTRRWRSSSARWSPSTRSTRPSPNS